MSKSQGYRATGFVHVLLGLLVASASAEVVLPDLVGNLRTSSQLIGCNRASDHLVISSNSHLDPRCTYTGGVEIVASEVVFDCRGAVIDDPERNDAHGIFVHAPTSVALQRVSVRNCIVRGFLNNFRVSRDAFRSLPNRREYINSFSRIELRNSRLLESRGSGIFIDAFVTDVRLRDLEVAHSGGAGIYLEAGSKDNLVLRNYIHDNGYGDVDSTNGIPFLADGNEFRYLSTGREGLAIDGSRDNRIARNRFENNSNGAIFLYKNCGEYVNERPQQWWPRRYGADGNRIRRNTIVDEPNGVWVGSRMSENQRFLDCSDESYLDSGLFRIHEDFAKNNTIRSNVFVNVDYAIRIEDDNTIVERNRIESDDPRDIGIVIGTGRRTELLGRPVTGTIVRGNRANIFLSQSPFIWVYGVDNLLFERNRINGVRSLIHQGTPLPVDFHLFVRQLWLP